MAAGEICLYGTTHKYVEGSVEDWFWGDCVLVVIIKALLIDGPVGVCFVCLLVVYYSSVRVLGGVLCIRNYCIYGAGFVYCARFCELLNKA